MILSIFDNLYINFRTHSIVVHLLIKYLMSNYYGLDLRGCRNKEIWYFPLGDECLIGEIDKKVCIYFIVSLLL